MYNREAINILLWKAEMPCLNVWGVSQASQLCDRCHMSPELCTTSSIYKKLKQPKRNGGEGNCPRPRVKATSWAFTSENPGSAGANKIEAVLGERLGL